MALQVPANSRKLAVLIKRGGAALIRRTAGIPDRHLQDATGRQS